MENYVSAGDRSLLNITSFDNILEVHVSYDIKAKMKEMPECETMLRKLFNSKLVIKETENSDENKPEEENKMEKIYTNHKPGMNLPKLVCPFKDKRRGWNKSTARDQAQLFLNLLEYEQGGRKSLVTTKYKTAEKPKFWPDSISFDKYDHPSSEGVSANEDLIESILEFHGYNIQTHCHSPKKQQKKKRQTKKKKKILNLRLMILMTILRLRKNQNLLVLKKTLVGTVQSKQQSKSLQEKGNQMSLKNLQRKRRTLKRPRIPIHFPMKALLIMKPMS